jgi:DMSO/TMAO reductase YedYZ heme-binding membrane subunit
MAKPVRDTRWFVLACESGGYLGTVWQGNSSGGVVRPRKEVISTLDTQAYHFISLFCGRDAAVAEARRTEQILPLRFRPVSVEIVGSGKDARIVPVC